MLAAIETSCDDTCVALLNMETREVIRNDILSQVDHSFFGGVVPEIAGRKHLDMLPRLFRYTLEKAQIRPHDLQAIAVTGAPGLIGSLLVGVNFAKGIAWGLDIPLYAVDHIEGHILSALIENPNLEYPYLCLIASGGHSHFVIVEEPGKYELIGKTTDDAIGEAYDKVGKTLGLVYPGGPILDKITQKSEIEGIKFPIPLSGKKTMDMSLSGLKTAVKYKSQELGIYKEKDNLINLEEFWSRKKETREKAEAVIVGFHQAIEKMIISRIELAMEKYYFKSIAFVGGVSANKGLRQALKEFAEKKDIPLYIPDFQFCCDNAAMIGNVVLHKKMSPANSLNFEATSRGIFS